MACDSLQERAGRGLSDDTNHVAVRAHGEATEANKDRRHQNVSAPDILIFNTNFPPPKMYECARLQNVRVGEICVKTTSNGCVDAECSSCGNNNFRHVATAAWQALPGT